MNIRRPSISCSVFLFAITLLSIGKAFAVEKQAAGITAHHKSGQTLLTFTEVDSPLKQDAITAKQLKQLRRQIDTEQKVRYRIYRRDKPITSVENLEPVAEVPPLTCWNADFYGVNTRPEDMALRYAVEDGKRPVAPETGIVAYNPPRAGKAYYAVTVVINGEENTSISKSNSMQSPVQETVGQGEPVLQRIEHPDSFNYVSSPTLYYYTRWESPPNCAAQGKPYDYVVAVPPNLAKPAPVGIHLHCWGANLNSGYGWWYQGEDGHILIASNQIPYDWWTGYHERYFDGPQDEKSWRDGVVHPYSQTRMFSFLDWVATRWDVDLKRTHVAGASMGGSGSPMLAIRHAERIAWATSWVGVHIPGKSPGFVNSYEGVYGKQAWAVKFEDGTSVWDHFNDAWYLKNNPQKEIGLICFSNGKNDSGIGWPQAAEFYRALQETRRPHIFVWGQRGHSQRAQLPISLNDRYMPMDLRIDQSQPAFTACSLDDDPGNGDPGNGDAAGQVNLYLYWETADIVDQGNRWEMTVRLVDKSPEDCCTVDITPRRVQQFKPKPGTKVQWENVSLADGKPVQSGEATVDQLGLITLEKVTVSKGKNRLTIRQ